jgi:hypothetical protein
MPRPTIEYLNTRHGHSRGAIRSDRLRNPVDDRAQWESLDQWEQAMSTVEATFADFRSWVRNLPPIDQITETEAPF